MLDPVSRTGIRFGAYAEPEYGVFARYALLRMCRCQLITIPNANPPEIALLPE